MMICASKMEGDPQAEFTSVLIKELSEEFHRVLSKHPINQQRIKEGLSPANLLLFRGAGRQLQVRKIQYLEKPYNIRGPRIYFLFIKGNIVSRNA
jgi:2,3-bisphosphoglycerate-independent phosphoglycerate mutase